MGRSSVYAEIAIWTLVLSLVFITTLAIPTAHAKSCIALGSRWWVPPEEQRADAFIASYFTLRAQWYRGYTPYNWYGSSTDRYHILRAARGAGHLKSVVFYIGHGSCEAVWKWSTWRFEMHWFITTDSEWWPDKVYDMDIYHESACRNVRFVILWTCHGGDVIGGFHSSGDPYGMPHAWLHTTRLSSDGYKRPDGRGYVFIGWTKAAPFLTANKGEGRRFMYYFIRYFFDRTRRSVNEALDYASRMVWGARIRRFEDSKYYKGWTRGWWIFSTRFRMVVYGDGSFRA